MSVKSRVKPPKPTATRSEPRLHTDGSEVQRFDELRDLPLGLDADVRAEMCASLNAVFSDARILRDLYKKYHWLMRGHTFYQLHLLMDKHAEEQDGLIDALGERVQTLGGIAAGDPRHVAELTSIPRPPDGAEPVPHMLTRLVRSHEQILVEAREIAERAEDLGDPGTADLLSSQVIPVNEMQTWFVVEHLVPVDLVETDRTDGDG
jgi:starvation-inducible DNA-binding protein